MKFISALALAIVALPVGASEAVTFHRDVEPVLQANCQQCHRPGEATPMSFLTYEETRPWARAIHEAVALDRMPPWFADPQFGEWSNAHVLSAEEKRVLIEWAETGAARGDPSDAPSPLEFVDGWNIGEPDFVLEMPEPFRVSAEGTIDYQYLVLPTDFEEDKWVVAAEVRPRQPSGGAPRARVHSPQGVALAGRGRAGQDLRARSDQQRAAQAGARRISRHSGRVRARYRGGVIRGGRITRSCCPPVPMSSSSCITPLQARRSLIAAA